MSPQSSQAIVANAEPNDSPARGLGAAALPGDAVAHQADPARRRRLRWRARRGLLENDLVLVRFFERYEDLMSDEDVAGLDQLLEASDNELLDLILRRTELQGAQANAPAQRVLERLREV